MTHKTSRILLYIYAERSMYIRYQLKDSCVNEIDNIIKSFISILPALWKIEILNTCNEVIFMRIISLEFIYTLQ
jgi:hypothetical protein